MFVAPYLPLGAIRMRSMVRSKNSETKFAYDRDSHIDEMNISRAQDMRIAKTWLHQREIDTASFDCVFPLGTEVQVLVKCTRASTALSYPN